MATDDESHTFSRLFVADRHTKFRFLIDIGADLCVFPHSKLPKPRAQSNYELSAAKGTTIAISIIGADFLAHYGLLVDIKITRLLDQITHLTSRGEVVVCESQTIKTIAGSSPYHQLLQRFPEITRPNGTVEVANQATKHHIVIIPGPPVAQNRYDSRPTCVNLNSWCTWVSPAHRRVHGRHSYMGTSGSRAGTTAHSTPEQTQIATR